MSGSFLSTRNIAVPTAKKNIFPLSLQAPEGAGKEEGEWEQGEAKGGEGGGWQEVAWKGRREATERKWGEGREPLTPLPGPISTISSGGGAGISGKDKELKDPEIAVLLVICLLNLF